MDDLAARYAPMIEQLAEIYVHHPVAHAQLRSLRVTREEWDNDEMRGGHFWFTGSVLPGNIEDIHDVNGMANDVDGAPIDIIIHVVEGKLNWGEWYRLPLSGSPEDFEKPIQKWPPATIKPWPAS